MAAGSSTSASTEATFEERVAFQLSVYANLIAGETGDDLEGLLRERVQHYLDANQKVIGGWEIVWGPGVKQFRTDLYAVNALYVARNVDDPTRYAIAIAGTNGFEPFEWLFENLLVQTIPWSPLRPLARLTLGTAIGLNVLKRITPSGDRPGAGQTLRQFLKGLPDKNIRLTVTGHSLGGALAPALALWLRDTQRVPVIGAQSGWDFRELAKISTLTTANPTPGNRRFAQYVAQRLETVRRYANHLDMVPKLWTNATIDEAKDFYTADGLPGPVPWLFDLAKLWSSGDFYGHLDPGSEPLRGPFDSGLVDPDQSACANFAAQLLHQHETAYRPHFDLGGLEWPETRPPAEAVWTPGLRRLFETTGHDLPPELARVPARGRPATAPVGDQPVDLPSAEDADSAEAEELAQWVGADLDFSTDTD
ncbi:hypothetical protein AB0I22_20390 [Streptomyces sp. NPDC050610]|uniref:lipase family protein n=1 Tax=Streptomyces sp. NPDC050610 TaxID=3157097 RepID=UPI0034215355